MDSKNGKNVKNDESDNNNKNYINEKNENNEKNEKNEKNEGGKIDMKNCCCELFCGPSQPSETCCNVDEPKLICKRCCCNMNYCVEAISIPENVAEMMADKMADKVVVKMEERAVALKHLVDSVETEVAADEDADSKEKGSKDGYAKKKLSISPDFDTKSTTSKKEDAVDEKMVRRSKVKRYSIYSAEFDAEGNPIKIPESKRKKKSVSGDGEANETPIYETSNNADETIKTSNDPDVEEKPKPGSKSISRTSTGTYEASKSTESEPDGKPKLRPTNFDKTTKFIDESEAEDKTNKTREKIKNRRSTEVADSETTKNNDDSDADDNAKQSIVEEMASSATMVLKTDCDRLAKMCCIERSSKSCCIERISRSCCIERPSFCICMCTPCICPDKKSPINGGASSNKRVQPNGNYGNGMQSIVEENTKTATVALQTDCDRHSKVYCFERSPFCVCMCTPCICPDEDSKINEGVKEPSMITNVESNAENRAQLLGEIRESMAAVVKDNLDKNLDNYFSCCIAKIEELAFRTERNEYLLKKMHKDLKLRISFLDRFMTQSNENNDGCECECTCEDNKGNSVSGGK